MDDDPQLSRRVQKRGGTGRLKLALLFSAVILGSCFLGGFATYLLLHQSPMTGDSDSPASAAPPRDAFEAHALQADLKACRDTFIGLGRQLAAEYSFSNATEWHPDDANAHSIQSLVGLERGVDKGFGAIFAAPVADGCEGNFVRILPQSVACGSIGIPNGASRQGALSDVPVYRLQTGSQMVLLPLRQGCLIITVARRIDQE